MESGDRKRGGNACEAVAPVVRWFDANNRDGRVLLAVLTDDGPGAYSMSAVNANLMGDALRDAAEAASKQQSRK